MDSEEQEFWNLDDTETANTPSDVEDLEGGTDRVKPETLQEDVVDEGEDVEPSGDEHVSEGPGNDQGPDAPDRKSPPSRAGKGEKAALAVLAVILLAGIIWGVTVFLGTMPAVNEQDQAKFPVQGTAVTIADAETYWREPDRTKDEGVRMDTRLIPAAIITLKDKPGTCALRFFFSNDQAELTGDSTTLTVTEGVFSANGTNQIEVHSTAGFSDPGDHAAYTTDQIETWHLVIMEGPDQTSRGAQLKQIARVPISFDRR